MLIPSQFPFRHFIPEILLGKCHILGYYIFVVGSQPFAGGNESTKVQNPRREFLHADYGCMYYTMHSRHQLTPHHCSSICRVSAPRVQNCIRVRMRSPPVSIAISKVHCQQLLHAGCERLKQYSIDQLSFLQSAGPESARKRLAVSSI